MNQQDIERQGLAADSEVPLEAVSPDHVRRRVDSFRIIAFDLPAGCIAGHQLERNLPIPLSHHAKECKLPAAKAIQVRIVTARAAGRYMRALPRVASFV
ncbi:hypothetical protein ABH945_003210 [Paraburkholderia sp. GAS333]|uniref:hypothetical protein n=1 Tax=Paraburkholderia sp. GAS333 TaxID=3156279 RepID=UPI003D2594D0